MGEVLDLHDDDNEFSVFL